MGLQKKLDRLMKERQIALADTAGAVTIARESWALVETMAKRLECGETLSPQDLRLIIEKSAKNQAALTATLDRLRERLGD